MRSIVFSFLAQSELTDQLNALRVDPPDFIIAFIPPSAHLQAQLDQLTAYWPKSLLVGATALSQFANGELCTSGSLHLFWFEKQGHHAWVEVVECDEKGCLGDIDIAASIERKRPDGALLLVDGVRFPVYALLAKLRQCCDLYMPTVVGGLASRNIEFGNYSEEDGAWVFVGNRVLPNSALFIGLVGVDIRAHVVRGWEPASPVFTVTKAKNNTLYSVDGIPAVEWYRDFFTIKGEMLDMPSASYGFPLIIDGPSLARKGVYRTMIAFDEPEGCVTFYGDIHTGDRIRLGLGNDKSLVEAAEQLDLKKADTCLLFSCVVRELVLGKAAQTEIATLSRKLSDIPLSGFFTFGEIGPSTAGKLSFYNQTGILALLTEKM